MPRYRVELATGQVLEVTAQRMVDRAGFTRFENHHGGAWLAELEIPNGLVKSVEQLGPSSTAPGVGCACSRGAGRGTRRRSRTDRIIPESMTPLISRHDLNTTRAEPDMIVTRIEIARLIGDVFQEPPVSKAELVAQATARFGRTPVVILLEGLPERSYNSLRDLWGLLPEVPIGS